MDHAHAESKPTPSHEPWTLKRIGLLVANVSCIMYLVFMALPSARDTPADTSSSGGLRDAGPTASSAATEETKQPAAAAGQSSSATTDPAMDFLEESDQGPYVPMTRPLAELTPAQMDRYRRLGQAKPRSVFPSEEWLSVSSEAMVAQRGVKLYNVLPCVGDDDRPPPFDLVFIPIGCFGDFVDRFPCISTTCLLSRSLANATFCGKRKFGAFLGDNFYPSGLHRADDKRFEKDLNAKFFRFPALRMPYYAMVGNHDLRPHTQLRQPGEHPFWIMPSFRYVTPVLGNGSVTAQGFIVDTHWGFEKSYPFMAEQAAWLDMELSKSTALWKIVMSHEPVFCFKGFGNNKGLVEFIHPVIKKHNVRLFVAAHVHGISLAKVEGGYYQLVSAGFADNIHVTVKEKRPRGYYHMGRGGTAVLFGAQEAVVTAFSAAGDLIFSHAIPLSKNLTVETTRGVEDRVAELWKG